MVKEQASAAPVPVQFLQLRMTANCAKVLKWRTKEKVLAPPKKNHLSAAEQYQKCVFKKQRRSETEPEVHHCWTDGQIFS